VAVSEKRWRSDLTETRRELTRQRKRELYDNSGQDG